MAGEFDFIRWIRSQTASHPRVARGIGDDLAVLRWSGDDLLIVGADQVLDGVHFDSTVHSPREIGCKAMNRNLSDCAAMACLPAAAVVTVALPKSRPIDFSKELYLGLRDAGDVFDCPIVGGDTGSWHGPLAISVSILGRSGGVRPVERSGAKVGDSIYVTGKLGGSILGRHMTFTPRVALARQLAEGGFVNAMIDLSDGLSRDIRHICNESRVGAEIDADAIPVHEDVAKLTDGKPPVWHALHDGEDYELLFTSSQNDLSQHPAFKDRVFRIGTITQSPGVWINRDGTQHELEVAGWEHQL